MPKLDNICDKMAREYTVGVPCNDCQWSTSRTSWTSSPSIFLLKYFHNAECFRLLTIERIGLLKRRHVFLVKLNRELCYRVCHISRLDKFRSDYRSSSSLLRSASLAGIVPALLLMLHDSSERARCRHYRHSGKVVIAAICRTKMH